MCTYTHISNPHTYLSVVHCWGSNDPGGRDDATTMGPQAARRESEGFFEAADVIGVPTPGAAISHQLLVCVSVCVVCVCVV